MATSTTNAPQMAKATDKKFELGLFDKEGKMNNRLLVRYFFLLTIGVFFLFNNIYLGVSLFIEYDFNAIESLDNFFELPYKLYTYYYANIKNIIATQEIDPIFLIMLITSLIISIITYLPIFISVKRKAKIQQNLTSIGLNQFYLYKSLGDNTYIFKLRKGEKMDYETWKDKSNNLKQLFGFQSHKTERYEEDKVKIQFGDRFPQIEDVKGLDHNTFLKDDKIFLGIGIKEIGEKIPQKELINNKYVAKYLPFQVNHMGIFGSSGFGKSVGLNGIFKSIFHNFNKVDNFVFVDFKQGIEAYPFIKFEETHKTNKIFVMADNRLMLLNYLEKLLIVCKARAKYIKSKNAKKIEGHRLITFFDEMAEILDYQPQSREERAIQERIVAIIETIMRIGRASDIFIGYSTQSPLQQNSGLTNSMKQNTTIKLTFGLTSQMQVSSVSEELIEKGINPTEFTIGQFAYINGANNEMGVARALMVKDNYLDFIKLPKSTQDPQFNQVMKTFYKEVVEEMKLEQQKMRGKEEDEDVLFSNEELLNDLLNDKLVNYNFLDKDIEKIENVSNQPSQFEEEEDNLIASTTNDNELSQEDEEEIEKEEEIFNQETLLEDIETNKLNQSQKIQEAMKKYYQKIESDKNIDMNEKVVLSNKEIDGLLKNI